MPVLSGGKLDAEVIYTGPFQAPISAGTQLGELVVRPEGLPELRFPLVAESDVAHGGFLAKVSTAAKSLIETMRSPASPEDGA